MIHFFNRLPEALQQSALYALALAGAKGVSLLMVPVFTHYLSPADYGRLDVLQTLADILSILIGLGLADTLFRFCKERDEAGARQICARLYGLSWMIAGLSFAVTQWAAPLICSALPGEITLIQTRLILTSLSLSGTILVPLAWLRFQGRAELFLSASLARTVFQAGLAALFLISGFGLSGFVLAGFIACLSLSLFLGHHQIKSTGVRFDFKSISTFGPYGGPLILAGFAGFILGSFDRWILAETIGTAAMADYALAAKFGLIAAVLVQPYDMWWQAKRFSVLSQPNGKTQSARFGAFAVMVCGAAMILVCATAPILIQWLTPAAYHGALSYVPYLVLFAGLHNLTQTLGFGIYTQKTTKLPALIDTGAALLALGAYFTLIPAFGIMGAIVATFIALAARFIMTLLMAQRTCLIPYPFYKLGLIALYCVFFASLTHHQTEAVVLVLLACGGLGGLGCLGLVMGLIPEKFRVTPAPHLEDAS